MSAETKGRHGGQYYLILGAAFLTLLALVGGASRADELQQVVVRAAAIIAFAAALWPLKLATFRDARGFVIAAAIGYLLLVAQLVPLPPASWAHLPGRELYVRLAQQTNEVRWRPMTLSPDRTLNALAALIPVTAIGLIAFALDFRGRMLLARLLAGIACASALLGLMQLGAGGRFTFFAPPARIRLSGCSRTAIIRPPSWPRPADRRCAREHSRAPGRHWSPSRRSCRALGGLLLLMGAARPALEWDCSSGSSAGVGCRHHYFVTNRAKLSGACQSSRVGLVAGPAFELPPVSAVSTLVWRGGATRAARERSGRPDPRGSLRTDASGNAGLPSVRRRIRHVRSGLSRFEPDALLSTIYLNQAHNEPVQLAIEGGVAGASSAADVSHLVGIRATVRAVRPRSSAARRAMGMAMAAATSILMLSSLVDYPLRTPLLSGLFAIACVELVRSRRRIEPSHQT